MAHITPNPETTYVVAVGGGEARGTDRLISYRPDLNADSPWFIENPHELRVDAGDPQHISEEDFEDAINSEDTAVRPATSEEVELIRNFDPSTIETAEGFEIGDLVVNLDSEGEVDFVELPRFVYRPDFSEAGPWVWDNPNFFAKMFRGNGPFNFAHEGDVLDEIEKGNYRRVTKAERDEHGL